MVFGVVGDLLAGAPVLPAVAQGQLPPPPTGRLAPAAGGLALPAAAQDLLYDQINSANGSWIIDQDSINNQYDTRAADDFIASLGSNSWQLTAVEVAGQFNGGTGPASVNSVNVELYADAGGLPGYRLYSAFSQPISGTASTGNFYLPLSPTVHIASNATYWVSVQAIQSSSWFWYWKERGTKTGAVAAWKNPLDSFGTGCVDWTAINRCFPNEGPDLLFRLYGTHSSSNVTPVLLSLDPNAAIHRAFTLNAHGVGFANGAVINWTLGGTKHISTTVTSSTQLSALVPAADVSGSYGAAVTVTVTNPGPCAGSCTSNALIFTLADRIYLPLVGR